MMEKSKVILLRNLLTAYKNELCERVSSDGSIACDMYLEDSCDRDSPCCIDWLLFQLEDDLSKMEG